MLELLYIWSVKLLITIVLKLRWAYLHVHPGYKKFTIGTESYFQYVKTGQIVYNYSFKD